MKLIDLYNSDLKKAYELYSSFLPDENGFENTAFGMDFDMFVQYVNLQHKHSLGIDLREGYVPDTQFILVDDDNNYVGIFKMRHYLNEFLKNGPGHIGYGISKKYRNKKYGTIGLGLVLKECKKKGINEVYLSVKKYNIASYKVQINNGAYVHHEDEEYYYTRINI